MIGYSIAASVIAIMIAIGGMILGVGYAMDDKKLKNFGRDELFQSLINGVILGSLFVFLSPGGLGVAVINGAVQSSGGGATCSSFMQFNYAICFADNYLVGLNPVKIENRSYPSLLDSSLALLVPISTSYALLGVISATNIDLGIASFSFSSILAPVLSEEEFLLKALTFAVVGLYTQAALLEVVAVIAVPLVLPMGIILRTFYFTRKLGGMLIAVAIGLYAVFPLTYLFDAQVTATYSTSLNSQSFSSFTLSSQNLQNEILSVGGSAVSSNSISNIGSSIISGVTGLVNSFTSMVRELVSALSMLIVEVFFFPLFSLVLTIVSIREMATILGSEVSFGKFDIF